MNSINNLLLITVVMVSLVACGTYETQNVVDQVTNGSSEEVTKEETDISDEKLYLPEKQLTYIEGKDGKQVETTAFFQQSPNKYVIYTLENFSLEQEEPRKDVILNEAFPEAMLRIEKVDSNSSDVTKKIDEMAKAVSEEVINQETIGLAPWLEGVVWKTAVYEGQQIDFLYIPSKQILASMYHPKEYTIQGEYLAMLETLDWQ